jgi:hypothetical protein
MVVQILEFVTNVPVERERERIWFGEEKEERNLACALGNPE